MGVYERILRSPVANWRHNVAKWLDLTEKRVTVLEDMVAPHAVQKRSYTMLWGGVTLDEDENGPWLTVAETPDHIEYHFVHGATLVLDGTNTSTPFMIQYDTGLPESTLWEPVLMLELNGPTNAFSAVSAGKVYTTLPANFSGAVSIYVDITQIVEK